MAVEITYRLDASQALAWGSQTKRDLDRNIRSAVDRSARFARAQAVKVIARDINVPLKELKSSLPLVQASRAGGPVYRALWRIGGQNDKGIRLPGGARVGTVPRGGEVEVSTFAVSGGGSAALHLEDAFTFASNGGNVVAIRLEHGPGTHRGGSRSYRAVYAERPATAMQGDNAPLKMWEASAPRALTALLSEGVQAAFDGSTFGAAFGRFYSGDAE